MRPFTSSNESFIPLLSLLLLSFQLLIQATIEVENLFHIPEGDNE